MAFRNTSPAKGKTGAAAGKVGGPGGPKFGLPPGIDSSILTEAEIEKLLQITSEKSL